MQFFTIESVVSRGGSDEHGAAVREFRTLEVEGRDGERRRHRACLIFSSAVEAARTDPVGYVAEDTEGGVALVAWMPANHFDRWRDAVAAGAGARVLYETRDEASGYLRRVTLTCEARPTLAAFGRRLFGKQLVRRALAMPL
jgi:hypothetical protein